jgi:predicted outer membrane repeat protein
LFWLVPPPAKAQSGCQNAITVTNAGDSGAGTLRQAVVDVCSGGTIDFAAGLANQTITLTSAELLITKTVTITNSNAPNLKVSGNNVRRIFNIKLGAVVAINSLSIINGLADDANGSFFEGGGILNYGVLTVNNSTFSGNYADQVGGAIYSGNILIINNSTFTNNSASNVGGGIYSGSTLTINNSIFSSNSTVFGHGGRRLFPGRSRNDYQKQL